MRTWIAKRLIDRAIDRAIDGAIDRGETDDNPDMPAWVAARLETDKQLSEYERSQRALVQQLRTDSAGWLLEANAAPRVADQTIQPSREPQLKLTAGVAWSAAACALIVIAVAWFNQPDDADTIAGTNDPMAGSVDLTANENDQNQAEPVHSSENDLASNAPEFGGIDSTSSPSELSQLTRNYVRRAGSVYGRGLALLGRE